MWKNVPMPQTDRPYYGLGKHRGSGGGRVSPVTNVLFIGLAFAVLIYWLGYSVALRGEEAGIYVVRYELVAYWLIVVAAWLRFMETKGGSIMRQPSYRVWLFLYFSLLSVMIVRSLFEGASLTVLLPDVTTYALVLVLVFGPSERFWIQFSRLLVLVTGFAVLYALCIGGVLITTYGIVQLPREVVRATDLVPIRWLLFGAPFLLLVYPALSRWGRLVAVVGTLMIFGIGVITKTRADALMGALPFVFAGVVWYKIEGVRIVTKRAMVIVALLGIIAVLAAGWGSRVGLDACWQELVVRGTREGDLMTTTLRDPRVAEAGLVMSLMSWDQYVLGAGVSATWTHWRTQDGSLGYRADAPRTMVHIGYIQLLFKGGFLFLALFLLFPITIGWRRLFTSRDIWTLGAAAMIAMYSINLLYGGFTQSRPGLVLLYLCAGRLAAR